jgi:ABC-type amino acid transport substrate-binding protein
MRRHSRYGFVGIALGAVVALAGSLALPATGAAEDAIEARPGGTLSRILGGAAVRFCADPNNLPFSSQDPQQPGFDVEIAKLVAGELGRAASFFWFPAGWGRRAIARLAEGDCDLFPGLPLDPGFAHANPKLILSSAYYTLVHALVIPEANGIRSVAELKGKTVSAEAASMADYYLVKQGYARHLYRRFHPEEAFEAMSAREADAALMWAVVAGWTARKYPELRLRLFGIDDPQMRYPMAIAMRKEDADLKAAVDRALARIGEKTVSAIMERYGVPATSSAGAGDRSRVSGAGEPTGAEVIRVAEEADEGPGVRQLWGMCTPCHGLNARGGGIVPSLKDSKLTDSEFVKAVLNGRRGTPMIPWKGLLSEKQILGIRDHIKNHIPD